MDRKEVGEMEERLLLRVPEVAEAIGCSKSKAYELVAKGLIPSLRIGGLLRVSAESLKRLIAEQVQKSQ